MYKQVDKHSLSRHGRIFKGGSPLRPNTEIPRMQVRKQSSRVVEPFNEFLKTLRKPAAQDIYSHLKTCVYIHQMHSVCTIAVYSRFQKTMVQEKVLNSTVDKLGEAVQEFYVVRLPQMASIYVTILSSEHG